MKRIELAEAASTNTWVREHLSELSAPVMISAVAQSAGRGQRGNTWESAPGANLTLSLLWRDSGVPVREQFAISEAVALAVSDTLREILEGEGMDAAAVKVKWPNDIYWGDKKICGILIEHGITGTEIEWSICGMGININQKRFESDAPNPVSLYQITSRESNLKAVQTQLERALESRLGCLTAPADRARLHHEYLRRLWRAGGVYPYHDNIANERIEASIADVSPTGMMTLLLRDGSARTYAFKEVTATVN